MGNVIGSIRRMAESATIYLCFQIGNKCYMYIVIPFGLMSAPWAFTEVIKQLKRWTAPRLFVLFQYLDGWLKSAVVILHDRPHNRTTVRPVLQTRTSGKSELVPTQRIEFLGKFWISPWNEHFRHWPDETRSRLRFPTYYWPSISRSK